MRCDYCETKSAPRHRRDAPSLRLMLAAVAGLIILLGATTMVAVFLAG